MWESQTAQQPLTDGEDSNKRKQKKINKAMKALGFSDGSSDMTLLPVWPDAGGTKTAKGCYWDRVRMSVTMERQHETIIEAGKNTRFSALCMAPRNGKYGQAL